MLKKNLIVMACALFACAFVAGCSDDSSTNSKNTTNTDDCTEHIDAPGCKQEEQNNQQQEEPDETEEAGSEAP